MGGLDLEAQADSRPSSANYRTVFLMGAQPDLTPVSRGRTPTPPAGDATPSPRFSRSARPPRDISREPSFTADSKPTQRPIHASSVPTLSTAGALVAPPQPYRLPLPLPDTTRPGSASVSSTRLSARRPTSISLTSPVALNPTPPPSSSTATAPGSPTSPRGARPAFQRLGSSRMDSNLLRFRGASALDLEALQVELSDVSAASSRSNSRCSTPVRRLDRSSTSFSTARFSTGPPRNDLDSDSLILSGYRASSNDVNNPPPSSSLRSSFNLDSPVTPYGNMMRFS
ncbi:MAG: hypothetical protein WDW38_002240, partial [Sanguina aurantia]